jgi:hypothetical protein
MLDPAESTAMPDNSSDTIVREPALAAAPIANGRKKRVVRPRKDGGPRSNFVKYIAQAYGPSLLENNLIDVGSRRLVALVVEDPNREVLLRYAGEFEAMLKGKFPEIPGASPSSPDTELLAVPVEGGIFTKDEIDALVEEVSFDDPMENMLDELGAGASQLAKKMPGGLMYDSLMKFMGSYQPGAKAIHPYVDCFTFEGKRYIGVGTVTRRSRRDPGTILNANCSLLNFKKIRDVSDEYLEHNNGRPVVLSLDDDNGGTFYLWLLKHKVDLEVRFWINITRGTKRMDDPRGVARIVMCDDTKGWRNSRS